jgi:hypothetical protein
MNPAEEQVAFYMQLGLAIAHFSHVESAVRSIVSGAIVDDLNRKAINVGFFSIDGFRAKMDFAEAVVDRTLAARKPEERDAWAALVLRIRKASAHRNKLAHWAVMTYPKTNRAGRRYALESWIQTKAAMRKSKGKPKDGALCLRDVVKLRQEFFSLTCVLDNFLHRLAGKPEPFDKSHEQPKHPPTIATLRAQIRGGLSMIDRPGQMAQ